MFAQKLSQGIFKKELNNRFLCLVELEGEDTLCYIPSSCKLSNFVDLRNKPVLLSPVESSTAKTKYSVYALCVRNTQILLNLSKANYAIEKSIRNRRFSDLGKRTIIKKEYTIEGYKSDLYIEDTKTVIEIKTVLSFNTEALFPSVYSKRAIDQLASISILLDRGYKACYIIASLNPRTKRLMINQEIEDYQEVFKLCVEKGMIVKAVSLKLINGEPIITSSLPVVI